MQTRMRSWCGRGSGATRAPIPIVGYHALGLRTLKTGYCFIEHRRSRRRTVRERGALGMRDRIKLLATRLLNNKVRS